jgi:hypothetical protein
MCLIVYIMAELPIPLVENDTGSPGISVTVPTTEVMEKVRSVVQGEHMVRCLEEVVIERQQRGLVSLVLGQRVDPLDMESG